MRGGGARPAAVARLARAAGARLGAAGAVLVCGGLGGVMAAAARGASASGGLVIGMLPGADPEAANPWVHVPIATGLGHARNTLVVAASEALIALPGEAGTRSEIAFAAVLGRPVVALGRGGGDIDAAGATMDPVAAADLALRLARERRSGRRR